MKYEQNIHECHDLDIDYYFRCQSLKDEPKISEIQSSEIVGSILKQSPRLNASETSYKERFLNHKMNFNYENLNLVHSENQDDFVLPKSLKKILGPRKTQGSSA